METKINLNKPKNLKPGDILLVQETTEDEASAVVINTQLSGLWDNRQKGGYQCAALAADMVQQIFNHLDQMEKTKRYKRRTQGIAEAKAKGARFGRKPKERPDVWETIREEWQRGDISAREGARRLGISHVTFLAWAAE